MPCGHWSLDSVQAWRLASLLMLDGDGFVSVVDGKRGLDTQHSISVQLGYQGFWVHVLGEGAIMEIRQDNIEDKDENIDEINSGIRIEMEG